MHAKRPGELYGFLTPEGISVQSPITTKSMEEGRGEVEDVIRPLNMYRY